MSRTPALIAGLALASVGLIACESQEQADERLEVVPPPLRAPEGTAAPAPAPAATGTDRLNDSTIDVGGGAGLGGTAGIPGNTGAAPGNAPRGADNAPVRPEQTGGDRGNVIIVDGDRDAGDRVLQRETRDRGDRDRAGDPDLERNRDPRDRDGDRGGETQPAPPDPSDVRVAPADQ